MTWTDLLLYIGIYLVTATILTWFFPPVMYPVWWFVVRVLNRCRIYGRDRVPKTGPVMLVSNHVSYLDWMILWVAVPRSLTFVLWSGYRRNRWLRFWLMFVRHRTIYIDNRTLPPHAVSESLEKIAKTLADGGAVLMFPEGRLTRNGQMMPFQRGFEEAIKRAGVPVPVVPLCLWNVWGCLLSHKTGRMLWRWPEEWRRSIAVYFGEPLPSTTPTAEVRSAVVECQADCALQEYDAIVPVHAGFVRKAARLRNFRRVAFVDASAGTDRTLTWPKALVGAWCLAKWLQPRLGTQRNVGIWLPTGLGSAFVNIALAFLRKTAVNLNYTAGTKSVHSAIQQTGMKYVITAKRFTDRVPFEVPDGIEVIPLETALAGIPGTWKIWRLILIVLLPGWMLDRWILRCRKLDWEDPLTIIFSSGSTGEPKGVMLSLKNISCNADGLLKGVNFTTDDRMLCTLPFFHSFGYTVCMWAPVSIGMMSVYYPDPRAAKEVGELSKRWQCSIILGTATFMRFYLKRCEADQFRAARLIICGAEKFPVNLALEFQEKFGVLPHEGYGCTETSPVVGANLPDLEHKGVKQISNVFGTVGQPLPGVVVRAFDLDNGTPLPSGQEGMLCAKGPNVMLGYWQQPEKSREVIRNGWYTTGDMGYVEPEGFVRITGRLSRFAKIAGEMVPIEKVEETLHEVMDAQGERLLVVAAVPDPKRGERLLVMHLPDVGVKLPQAFELARTQGLPNLWIPDIRDCRVVECFPVLGSGKLDLRSVAELAKSLAG